MGDAPVGDASVGDASLPADRSAIPAPMPAAFADRVALQGAGAARAALIWKQHRRQHHYDSERNKESPHARSSTPASRRNSRAIDARSGAADQHLRDEPFDAAAESCVEVWLVAARSGALLHCTPLRALICNKPSAPNVRQACATVLKQLWL